MNRLRKDKKNLKINSDKNGTLYFRTPKRLYTTTNNKTLNNNKKDKEIISLYINNSIN